MLSVDFHNFSGENGMDARGFTNPWLHDNGEDIMGAISRDYTIAEGVILLLSSDSVLLNGKRKCPRG